MNHKPYSDPKKTIFINKVWVKGTLYQKLVP